MKLNAAAEEVATFFAKMLDHEYTTKDIFRKNFYKDWRKVRTSVVFNCLQPESADGVKFKYLSRHASDVLSFILGNDIRGKV